MRKVLIVVFGLCLRGALVQPLFAQQVSPLLQETKSERFTLAPGALIRFDGSYGELDVEGWDQPAIEITVIKTLPYDTDKSKAKQDLSVVQVTTDRTTEKEVVITTKIATHDGLLSSVKRAKTDVWVEYQIHAPRDSKLVVEHHEKGTIQVNNMAGNIEANSSSGDILVILPDPESRKVDAKTQFGTVVSDFGQTHREHFVGRSLVTGTSTAALVHLRMGYGGITMKTLPKEAYTADQ
jgi:Putative adhesin